MNNNNNPLDHFNERSVGWNDLYARPQFRDRLNLFSTKLRQYVSAGEILDYGCGGGIIACEIAGTDHKVTGVDGAEGMVTEATRLAADRHLENVSFQHIDPAGWRCSAQYQAIVCSSVLEYVAEDEGLLATLSEGLAESGYLLISVPTKPSLLGFIEDMLLSTVRKRSDTTFANRRYKLVDFEQMLNRCGLQMCETTSFEFPVFGRFGVACSRIPWLGLMTLVVARKI